MLEHVCECLGRGDCPVHKIFKGTRQHAICKGTASGITEEQRAAYISHWYRTAGVTLENPDNETITVTPRAVKSMPITPPVEPILGRFPGTNLAILLKKCGVIVNEGCNCESWIAQMNSWGVEGCWRNRQEIISRLSEKSKGLSTSQIVWTGILMMWRGMRPTIGELVDEAIWQSKNSEGDIT